MCTETTAKIKVLHQKPLIRMPTRTFPGTYGIELLWWHSVTNGLEEPHGVRAYACSKKLEDFLLCTGTAAKIKVLHQKPLVLMLTRTFPGTYGIELLWWHSVTNCSGDPHGVQTYGYIKKWEDCPVLFERNCQNRSVTPKTINSNGYKNLLRYIRNITIMVAFRNKWF